jgi:transposase
MITPPQNSTTPFISLEKEVQYLRSEVELLRAKNEELEFQIKQLRKILYGSKSEKTKTEEKAPDKTYLFETEVVQEKEAVEEKKKSTPKRKAVRKAVSAQLETKEIVIAAPEDKKYDSAGKKLSLLGYDSSERYDYQPAKILRVIIKLEKWGHSDSRDLVYTSKPPQTIVPKGILTDLFLLEIIYQKFFMSNPLYRQIQSYTSSGARFSKSTLSDAVRRFAEFFEKIYEALHEEVLNSKFIHGDETELKHQVRNKGAPKGERVTIKRGYLWVFRSLTSCYFHYGTRGAIEVSKVFELDNSSPPQSRYLKEEEKKYFLSDDYSSYDCALELTKLILMGCWAHVRRKFVELKGVDKEGEEILKEINKLYRIEREVKEEAKLKEWNLEEFYKERLKVRQEQEKEVVEEIMRKAKAMVSKGCYPPSNVVGKALNYMLNLEKKLKVYLEDGELPIDNNAAEQILKPTVIGRKNYLFVGSEDAGKWAAICYSVIESCRLMEVDPREYLVVATEGIHQGKDPATLTPKALKNQLRTLPKNF